MLHGSSAGAGANFRQHFLANGLVAALRLDLDELVAGQGEFDFLDDVFRQAGIAGHHHRTEGMRLGAQKTALRRGDGWGNIQHSDFSAKSVAL